MGTSSSPWQYLIDAAGAALRTMHITALSGELYTTAALVGVLLVIGAGFLLRERRRRRRTLVVGSTPISAAWAPARSRRRLVAALTTGVLLVVLGTALPAAAATNLTVVEEPIKISTITVTLNGNPVAQDSTVTMLPGSAMSVSTSLKNDGSVPIQLSLSTISLMDFKGLGAVTTWNVVTGGVSSGMNKLTGTLGGSSTPQVLTTLQPGQSRNLVVQVKAPTTINNRYQNTSMRFRLVLTETEIQ